MSMIEWAEKEVEIACKKERGNDLDGEWNYGCACYESALKAFKSLMEDGHSGFSIGLTKNILVRLIEGKPLTPIEDTEDVWRKCVRGNEDYDTYQCNRMFSLFKDVYEDGTVKYSDNDRIVCVDYYTGVTYSFGFIRDMVNEMFPITMPYLGTEVYKVYASDFLYDEKNGDFDTIRVHHILKPDGEKITIDRYFKFYEEGLVEIGLDEYSERYERRVKR